MTRKQSYEQLEQRIKKLEEEAEKYKQVEEALRKSKERYRTVLEVNPDPVVLYDIEGRVTYINPAFEQKFGWFFAELVGKQLDFVPDENREETQDAIDKILSGKKIHSFETRRLTKKGTILDVQISSSLFLNRDGQREGSIATLRDVTERKQTEEALQESEIRFRETAEMLTTVIVEYDLNGILTYVNPYGYELLGYDPEDLGNDFHVLRLVAPEEKKKHYERLQRLLQGEQVSPTEYRLLSKDGFEYWGLITSALIYKNGEAVGVRTSVIDITERKKAEEALKQQAKELEIKTKSLKEVNTAMKVLLKKREEDKAAIENNVLTNIKEMIAPYIEKMKKTRLDEQQEAFLSIIESNMKEIISPFSRRLSLKYLKLTPKEIQIAYLIKHGNTTKKIAKIMKVSPRTIDTHRKNIRRKIGLDKKRANLRSHLLTLH